ncbi:hypothetical protein [Streptomyces sp. NPDC059753]|uniref:hypothetical protein n=1 Tax=Streptomyces sp. NPDC059753 TaxID=3346933 RepID=UPI0036633BFB
MHSIRMKRIAVLLGAAAFCLAAPAPSFADSGTAPKAAYCGTDGATGLAVSATVNVSCGAALQAAAAYTKAWHGTAAKPVQVRRAGAGPDPSPPRAPCRKSGCPRRCAARSGPCG